MGELSKTGGTIEIHDIGDFVLTAIVTDSILDEHNPKERQLGLDMGLAMLQRCDELWCFGDHISHGMLNEIEEAQRQSIPTRRVMEQEQGFQIGEVKNHAPRMEMGTLYEWCIRHPDFDLKEQAVEHCLQLLEGICSHANNNA